jgi:glyoxylase-like metal-dependent hydrolase (beta-lactamase superfamily II)
MLQRDVAEGVHRIEDARTNWYLVEEDRGRRLTVVDCGYPASWRSLQSALSELGREPADVEAVVLTHAHPDHIGFAERIRAEWHVPVWLHERDRSLSRHPFNYEKEHSPLRHASLYGLRFAAGMVRAGVLRTRPLGDVRAFADEEELDVPGRPRPVPTPGHTHGHTAFHLPQRGVVIAGDALTTHDPYANRRGAFVMSGASNADSTQAVASLQQIADTGAATVLVGHGDPWTDGAQAAVDAARAAGPS